jgi:hypothetical protein
VTKAMAASGLATGGLMDFSNDVTKCLGPTDSLLEHTILYNTPCAD